MSIISGVEVAEKSRWLHMAAVMSQRLHIIIQRRRVSENDIPRGVLSAADNFLQSLDDSLALEFLGEQTLQRHAYISPSLAQKKHLPTVASKARTKVVKRQQSFAEFVHELRTPHNLSQRELDLARKVQQTFTRLYQAGEDEAFEQSIAMEFSG